jgi:4-amino-4-deoxy-L-arabinose transferase-like glycosyltransferase
MILDEGHWLVPRLFDRHLELQKPPMYYWLVALLGWLNGGIVDAWTVRLPAALSAFVTVLFVYYLGVRSKRPLAGLLAASILASCVHFTWLARVGRIDMPLTMTITLALGAFHLARLDDATFAARILWRAFGYAMLGAGLLLKGPIAIVLPAVVTCAAWLVRERRFSWNTSLWWGLPLTFAIAAPWYVWANLYTDNQLWDVFFWYHNVERGLGGAEALASYPWWFYGPRAVLDLLPWSLALPIAIYLFLRCREYRADVGASLGLVWFAAVLAFLSCMSFKRADYLLPAYPGMAIFLGSVTERWWQTRTVAPISLQKPKFIAGGFAVAMAFYACGWLTYNCVFAADHEQPCRAMAAEIRRQTRGPVVFFRAESHVLAYHVGQPVLTVLEWENLEIWTRKPRIVYYVMPDAYARECRDRLPTGALEEVTRLSEFAPETHDRPLVVLRSKGSLASRTP